MAESDNLPPVGAPGNSDAAKEKCAADNLNSELPCLRAEILKSEETRLDFLKYKLVAAATLAAVAFGLGTWKPNDHDVQLLFVLPLIPFVCVYVDAVCYHDTLRILVIAKYLRCSGDTYEQFLDKWSQVLTEKSCKSIGFFFQMEDWVLDISTRALAVLVILAGLFPFVPRSSGSGTASELSPAQGAIISLFGLLGLLLSWLMKDQYLKRRDKIFADNCVEIHNKSFSGK